MSFCSLWLAWGNDFIGVFTSFGDIVGSVLGLNVESKKSDVGNYFNTVKETVEGIKNKLNKIVADMKREGNPNAAGVESAVNKLVSEILNKIIGGAKTASEAIGDANEPVGNVSAGGVGAAAGAGGDVVNLVKGIKDIVDVVLKGVGNAEAGTDKKATDGSSARGAAADNEAGKLFDTANAGDSADKAKKSAADAAKAVGAVTGADILKAMIKNGIEDSAKAASAKDGTIAGAIALRAMAKGGKFANTNNAATVDVVTAVKGAAVSSVTKALDTLTIAIRKTIDEGLKTVKEAIKMNSGDIPVITEAKNQ